MAREYMHGSSARAVEVMEPESIKQAKAARRQAKEELRQRQEARKQAKKLHKVNMIYTFALIGAMSVLIYLLVGYIQLQASIQVNATQVTQLEQQLSKLTESNNLRTLELDTNIDYNAIYEIATNELGMVYPDKSQVIEYDSVTSEYVKQYSNIPR